MNTEQLAELTNAIRIVQDAETIKTDVMYPNHYICPIIISVMNYGVQIDPTQLRELSTSPYQWNFVKEYSTPFTEDGSITYEYELYINEVRFFFITHKPAREGDF